MGKSTTSNSKKTSFVLKPKKLGRALLTGFAVSFVLIIGSSLLSYFENSSKFIFSVWDFLPMQILWSTIVCLVIAATLYFTKGIAHKVIFASYVGLLLAAVIQRFITTLTFVGLPGDGNDGKGAGGMTVFFNLLFWVGIILGCVAVVLFWKNQGLCKTIMVFAVILCLIMQTVMLFPAIINSAPYSGAGYLTTENMFELSKKDNVVVFCLDRFDTDYFEGVYLSKEPDTKQKLDGFTYYADNISTYPRTYPGVVSMVTGENTDFSKSRAEYLDDAYLNSSFLKDLKKNNYNINLYISDYYSYNNVPVVAENHYLSQDYEVVSPGDLASKMFELGAYYWAPEAFKSKEIGQKSFDDRDLIRPIDKSLASGEPAPEKYSLNDPETYDKFVSSGITTQEENSSYTFYHLRGCHAPFNMDENCNFVEGQESNYSLESLYPQMKGNFKFIYEYIDQMKRLDIYEDSTIIITGDHGALVTDKEPYDNNPVMTALLVKEKGQSGTEMVTSYKPVSQDNLIATIVKSAGIDASKDYGKAYSEVSEESVEPRYQYFQTHSQNSNSNNYTYQIVGNGRDFANWKLMGEPQDIGSLY